MKRGTVKRWMAAVLASAVAFSGIAPGMQGADVLFGGNVRGAVVSEAAEADEEYTPVALRLGDTGDGANVYEAVIDPRYFPQGLYGFSASGSGIVKLELVQENGNSITFEPSAALGLSKDLGVYGTVSSVRITAVGVGSNRITITDSDHAVVLAYDVTVSGRDVLNPVLYRGSYASTASDDVSGLDTYQKKGQSYTVMSGKTVVIAAPGLSEIVKNDGSAGDADTFLDSGRITGFRYTTSDASAAKIIDVGTNTSVSSGLSDNAAVIRTGALSEAGKSCAVTVEAVNRFGDTLASGKVRLHIVKNTTAGENIRFIGWNEDANGTNLKTADSKILPLDTVVHKTAQLYVEADGAVSYSVVQNSTVIKLDKSTGKITVAPGGSGTATVIVSAAGTGRCIAETASFTVSVSAVPADSLWAVDGSDQSVYDADHPIELDAFAYGSKTSVKIKPVSALGNSRITASLFALGPDGVSRVAVDSGRISMTGSGTCQISAGSTGGDYDAFLLLSSSDDSANRIGAAETIIPIHLYGTKADVITQGDISLDIEENTHQQLQPSSSLYRNASDFSYALGKGSAGIITVSAGGVVWARRPGDATVIISQPQASGYRATSKTVKVHVSDTGTVISAPKKAYSVVFGKTVSVKAGAVSSKGEARAVSYKSANTKVATVDSKGVVTGKKTGTTSVTVSSGTAAPLKITVKVTPRALVSGNVSVKLSPNTYTGKYKKPAVSVRVGKVTLKKGTDYTVSGTTRAKNVGTYKVQIKGKGNYKGTFKKAYKIKRAATKFVSSSRFSKKGSVYKRYALIKSGDKNKKIRLRVTGGVPAGRRSFSINKKGLLTARRTTAKGTYWVRVSVPAGRNHKAAVKTFRIVLR